MKKKVFLLLVLFSYSQSALCEWIYLGSTKNNTSDYYIQSENFAREGNLRNALVLFNYNDASIKVRSQVGLNEYDCKNKKVRTNYLIEYDGEMGTGEVVTSHSPTKKNDKWRSVDLSTVSNTIMEVVCNFKSEALI